MGIGTALEIDPVHLVRKSVWHAVDPQITIAISAKRIITCNHLIVHVARAALKDMNWTAQRTFVD